jgi:hypothetical protein
MNESPFRHPAHGMRNEMSRVAGGAPLARSMRSPVGGTCAEQRDLPTGRDR